MTTGILSPYLIAISIAWFGSHVIKYIINLMKGQKIAFGKQLFTSGGMPSSHSATVVALMTVIGFCDGVNSGLFGMSVLLAIVVMYDAVKVRRSSGEQGEAIVKLIKDQNRNIKIPRVYSGHNPLEVAIGALLGYVIGVIVFLSTK
jgi:acid phosphatase family membrane protein YuiD